MVSRALVRVHGTEDNGREHWVEAVRMWFGGFTRLFVNEDHLAVMIQQVIYVPSFPLHVTAYDDACPMPGGLYRFDKLMPRWNFPVLLSESVLG